MTLHAVPNQHLHLFPIFYTLWSPPTIQNTLLKLPLLNLYWNDSILQVYPTSCKQLSALPTHFKYHGTLFWNYSNLNYAEKAQSCKYIQILADPFSVLPKPFMWVDLLFGNYLIMLKVPPPSTTSLKESSVKKSVFETHSHTTLQKLCAWTSLEGAFVEKEKFPTYHKLTHHTIKSTKYSQLQSTAYCY